MEALWTDITLAIIDGFLMANTQMASLTTFLAAMTLVGEILMLLQGNEEE